MVCSNYNLTVIYSCWISDESYFVCNFYFALNGIQPQRYKRRIPDWAYWAVGGFPALYCGRQLKQSRGFCWHSIIGCGESWCSQSHLLSQGHVHVQNWLHSHRLMYSTVLQIPFAQTTFISFLLLFFRCISGFFFPTTFIGCNQKKTVFACFGLEYMKKKAERGSCVIDPSWIWLCRRHNLHCYVTKAFLEESQSCQHPQTLETQKHWLV